jgi:hypothetical protein
MKISISRKGVDGGNGSGGGMASPILPCGCLCSIPIPSAHQEVKYADIKFGKHNLQQICKELKPSWSHEFAHLDPDLRYKALEKRPENWRAAFGQSGAAAGLLINQSVGDGSLFVFFGWFRRTKKGVNGKLAFDRTDVNGRHIVWGWLEVGRVWEVVVPPPDDLRFLDDHPHVKFSEVQGPRNTVYVSSESGLKAGVFSTEKEGVVLTKEGGGNRSLWSLPEEFESLFLTRDLSYHHDKARWAREGKRILLQTVAVGQEFVFDGDLHSEARKYFVDRIEAALAKPNQCSHDF